VKLWVQTRAGLGLLLLCLVLSPAANAQNWTAWQGPAGGAQLRARLLFEADDAAQHMAAVEVEVGNIWLHDPDLFSQSGLAAGVLDYQIDNCPPIITTDTHIRFADISSGPHTITVRLLGTDNQSLGPKVRLAFRVP
jgi:hypothetical protein